MTYPITSLGQPSVKDKFGFHTCFSFGSWFWSKI